VPNSGLPSGRKLFEDKEKAWLKEKAPGLAKLKDITCFLREKLAAQAAHIFIATVA
jgi:hypothetical protein